MIKVSRPPVLVLWAAVVAERLGFESDEALSIGRAFSNLGSKGKNRNVNPVRSMLAPATHRCELQDGEMDTGDFCTVRPHIVLRTQDRGRAERCGRSDAGSNTERRLLDPRGAARVAP